MIEKNVLVESTSDNIDIGFTFIVVCQPLRFIMRPLPWYLKRPWREN
jgi:hypothetical protein